MSNERYLIVIENKATEERFLWHPFASGKPVVPDGYYKITQQVPLNEAKYGNLPILEIKEVK